MLILTMMSTQNLRLTHKEERKRSSTLQCEENKGVLDLAFYVIVSADEKNFFDELMSTTKLNEKISFFANVTTDPGGGAWV